MVDTTGVVGTAGVTMEVVAGTDEMGRADLDMGVRKDTADSRAMADRRDTAAKTATTEPSVAATMTETDSLDGTAGMGGTAVRRSPARRAGPGDRTVPLPALDRSRPAMVSLARQQPHHRPSRPRRETWPCPRTRS